MIRVLTAGVATAVLSTLLAGFAPVAAQSQPETPLGDTPVPGDPLRPAAPLAGRSDHTDPEWLAPAVAPPSPGATEVDVPEDGLVRVGGLPLLVGRPAGGGAAPARVRVTMLDQEQVRRIGGQIVGFRVERADGGGAPAHLAVRVDLDTAARSHGGDFAARARLVQVPECALLDPLCLTPSLVGGLTNDVYVPGEPGDFDGPRQSQDSQLFAVATTSAGPSGDWSASPLSGSDRWQVGVSSGDFSYAYSVPMAPAPAGPVPELTLAYSSQSVDGRGIATNSQPSQVGEGWSFSPGFIERRFTPCAEDGLETGDLCIGPSEWFLNLGGRSSEIVRGVGNEWRLRDDPAWRVQNWTGGSGGSNAGDYFTVLTPDGTKYWFGLGKELTTNTATNSAWNIPVVGNNVGEACHAGTPAVSWCYQTWRFNLDRIQDRHGTVATLFWAKEQNRYARNNALSTVYDRSGHLARVEYGKRTGAEGAAAPARVTIDMAYRCAAQESCPTPGPGVAGYPDVPLDLMCTSPTSCSHTTPSFWSVYQVSRVTAGSLRPGTTNVWDPVDRVDLSYSFPPTDESTPPSLWLWGISRTGLRPGAAASLPPVRMTGTLLPNRVDYLLPGVPMLNKYRIGAIQTELGATATVTYGRPHPCPTSPYPATWDDNPYDCYPQQTRNGSSSGFGIFHKYQVTQLEVDDAPGPAPNMLTRYTYNDAPAWHYDDSLIPGPQTWGDYRGHSDVFVETMTAGGVAKTKARHLTFRGMHGDKGPGGQPKVRKLTDSDGVQFDDLHYLAGYPLETRRMDGAMTLEVDQHRYWAAQTVSGPTGYQQHAAQYVREWLSTGKTRDTTASTPTYRKRQVVTTFEPTYGLPTKVEDKGDLAIGADDTCVSTSRTANVSAWLLDFPYQTRSYSGTCTGAQVGQSDTYYDGSSSLTAAPTKGNATAVAPYWDATHRALSRATYDGYGRVTSTMTPTEDVGLKRSTTTAYAPATGLPTSITVTNPLLHVTRTDLTQGLSGRVTDANGFATNVTRDALGRITEVLRPGDTAGLPSTKYAYSVGTALPSRVMTSQLLDGSRYVNTFSYVDGLGRPIETQTPSPSGSGRVVTATRYDDQGQVAARTQPLFNSSAAGSGVLNPVTSAIPYEQRFTYDALGRTTTAAQYHLGAGHWQTVTSYTGLTHTVDSPVRTDVTYHTDAFGRISRVVERPQPGPAAATTGYTYTPTGLLDTITDDAGNVTSIGYDWLGRRVSSSDPDQGAWSFGYDANGNQTSVTDAQSVTVTSAYDVLGRRTASGSSAWTYDLAPNGKGLPASSSRAGYVVSVTGYDGRARPTGRTFTIPAAEGLLAGSYDYDYGYDSADHLTRMLYPAAGGLGAETVTTTYNDQGAPATTGGASSYVLSTSYHGDGRLAGRRLGSGAVEVDRAYTYGDPAGRLTGTVSRRFDMPTATPVSVENTVTNYDAAGNVTSVRDTIAGQSECFRYSDGLSRLTAAFTSGQASCAAADNAGPVPYNHAYAYDTVGNMLSGPAGTYTYPTGGLGVARPHAATAVGGTTFTHDANGATKTRTSGGVQTAYGWDEHHRLASVTTGANTTSMVYDADGNRLVRRDPGATTLYLDGMELRLTGSVVAATRYYGSVAMRTSGADGLWWTLADRQHSTSLTVNATTGETKRQRYLPYGGRRDPAVTLPTERGFLGKSEDPTGLSALGARYHDPTVGRLLSVDPLLDLADPQSLNPYSYARNNPATLSDPTGLMAAAVDSAGGYDVPAPKPPGGCSGIWGCVRHIGESAVSGAWDTTAATVQGVGALAGHAYKTAALPLEVAQEVGQGDVRGAVERVQTHATESFELAVGAVGAAAETAMSVNPVTGPLRMINNVRQLGVAEGLARTAYQQGSLVPEAALTLATAGAGKLVTAGRASKAARATRVATEAASAEDAVISGILRDAVKGKGNFGLGSGSSAQADVAGRAWVGDGYRVARDGKTLISRDGLRQFRPPSYKPNLDKWQANFEERLIPNGAWQSNGHLDIVDRP